MPSSQLILRRRLRRAMLSVSGVAWAASAVITITGGFSLRVAGVSVRAQRPATACAIGLACLVAATAMGSLAGLRGVLESGWRTRDRSAVWVVAVVAVFWVVPVAGATVIWLTWRIGVHLAGRAAAAAAAVLMACSPAFLFQIVQPMSDVPVTA